MPIFLKSYFEPLPFLFPLSLLHQIPLLILKINKKGIKKNLPPKILHFLVLPFALFAPYSLLFLRTKYATANKPAMAKHV